MEDDLGNYWEHHNRVYNVVESDIPLVQPVGFVWFSKLRCRVKAVTRKVEKTDGKEA